MARKRKSSRRTTLRRRSVGAIKKDGIITVAAIAAGVVAGRFVVQKLNEKMLESGKNPIDPKLVAAGQIAVGYLASGKVRNPMLKNVLTGIAIGGATNLLTNVVGVAGVGRSTNLLTFRTGSGVGTFKENNVVGRSSNPDLQVIAGMF